MKSKSKSKFVVDFGFSPASLGKVKTKINKLKKPNKYSQLNAVVQILDDNPVCMTTDDSLINKICNNEIYNNKNGYWARLMTITLNPSYIIKEYGLDLNNYEPIYMKNKYDKLFESVYNKFKKYECEFVACEEYHKYRRIKHIHAIYISKNLNRVRNLKKSIKELVGGSSRSCIRDEKIEYSDKALKYILKPDDNNINLTTKVPEHPKEFYYWLDVKK